MAGGDATAVAGETISTNQTPLHLVNDIVRISTAGFTGCFKRDCTEMSRRVALLAHLLEDIRDLNSDLGSSLFDLTASLEGAKGLLLVAGNFNPSDGAAKKIAFQFQCVRWKLEKALENLPYDHFDISEEVQEQVELVRSQLRRATERYGGSLTMSLLSRTLSQPLDTEIGQLYSGKKVVGSLQIENIGNLDYEAKEKVPIVPKGNGLKGSTSDQMIHKLEMSCSSPSSGVCLSNNEDANLEGNSTCKNLENKKPDSTIIPDDFRCPISLELMRDPVIVATGQTYERSYIQRWIDCGNTTCPKTQQKLQSTTLTPNYVLRSLITQWCTKHNIEQSTVLTNGKIRKSDGSFRDVSGDIAAIEALVRKLSSQSIEECAVAVSEIRSLSKRNTDNRILIGEAGAIPVLVNLLTSDDSVTQDNAVTSILNLSIYENNKGLIMLAGAIPSIVQVLRVGSMEARENAAATLFSLSLVDDNKIIIGASGAILALVELLENGSIRGKKDAATALFNLCIYQGNKGRAVRAGIITPLLKMLTDSSSCMVDEALTILSVLASHPEAKVAIVKASTIPILIDLTRTGLPRNKENTASILLSLCKRDTENLTCISRLGAAIPLTELAKSGTERAKRKATSLLEHLRRALQL